VGAWLLPALAERGARVFGVHRPDLPAPELPCEWIAADVRDASQVLEAVRAAEPELIVHLAGLAAPREAERDPLENQRLNFHAVSHLLNAVSAQCRSARTLLVSSGEVYGRRPTGAAPAREDDPLAPPNAYAAAKLAAEQLARLAARDGLDVVLARPFNHTGPGRPPDYAESSFARQIAGIERGEGEPVLRVGNLSAIRDFSDVRDVVEAYLLLLDRGRTGQVYNVCSGRGRSIRSILELLLASSRSQVTIKTDPERYEALPDERIASVGDPSRLRELGWRPCRRLDDTLAELLDHWRARA
jgi:GDP-4-dehydro-6-deoxy-D-mannose reductase